MYDIGFDLTSGKSSVFIQSFYLINNHIEVYRTLLLLLLLLLLLFSVIHWFVSKHWSYSGQGRVFLVCHTGEHYSIGICFEAMGLHG